MTVPIRTFLVLGVAVGLLGAGHVFVLQPGVAALPNAPAPKVAGATETATPAAPAVKPASTLVMNRAPVPLTPRSHETYFVSKQTDAAVQTASATTSPGQSPPQPDNATSTGDSQAKAAIELDGYKNVRALEKGPDGLWRGRAMRGGTEITVRVDAGGSVSAE